MPLPNDPFILLSVINTKLRDFYPSLAELCSSEDISCEELETALAGGPVFYLGFAAKGGFAVPGRKHHPHRYKSKTRPLYRQAGFPTNVLSAFTA